MLKIRLRRFGKKHQPTYRIVVAEETSPIQGKFIAEIGHYNPKTKVLVLKKEEATEWMNKGAKPSNTVAKLMKNEKMKHNSIVVHLARRVSKKELEAEKAKDEAEKAKEQAEKEAAKEEWDKEAAEKAKENESSDEKLVEKAEEAETTETPASAEAEETTETPVEEEKPAESAE